MTVAAVEPVRLRIGSRTLLPVLVVIVVASVAAWAGEPYLVGVWHDDGAYALLAKSVAMGHGLRFIDLPGEPAAIHQPPLYPLLLAAVWRLGPPFPDNVALLLAVNAALLGVAAFSLYRLATTQLGWRDDLAALVVMLTMVSVPVLTFASALLSEPMFLAALCPTLLLAERAVAAGDRKTSAWAGIAIGALTLVRSHGVALLIALLLVSTLHGRRRIVPAMIAAGAVILVVLPWQLWTTFATPHVPAPLEGAYGSYVAWLWGGVREGGVMFVRDTAIANLREIWLLLLDRVAVGSAAWLRVTAALSLGLLVVVGAWTAARRAPVTVAFTACFLGIVLVWPYAPWRFVWTVWPLLLVFAAEGGRRALERWTGGARPIAIVAMAIPAAAMTLTDLGAYGERAWLQPARVAAGQVTSVVRWVNAYTRPDDVVLTEASQVVALFTGRRAAPAASFTAREYLVPADSLRARAELQQILRAVSPRYVIAMAPTTRQAALALAAAPKPDLREIGALRDAGALVFAVIR